MEKGSNLIEVVEDIEQKKKLKLFISYSHKDEDPFIEEFKTHITQLEREGLIEVWSDRKILPGEDLDTEISNNLEDAEFICLFISANFLASDPCMKETVKALELRRKKGITVIPIILSSCGWQHDKNISKLMALPQDGKTVKSFEDRSNAWLDVYTSLRKIIKKEIKIRELKLKEKFYENFLQDTVMLTKANSQKERVSLDDIFVYPELTRYNLSEDYKEKINSEELVKNFVDYSKIVIAGENQSGKTTLCKTIFKEAYNNNFVPVYIDAKKNPLKKNIESTIYHSFPNQYEKANTNGIDKRRIIPIIDNFHFVKDKETHIKNLFTYDHFILIVDDIFDINIEDEKYVGLFTHFKIREFRSLLRYELVNKWINLTDKEGTNDIYKEIDKTIRLINVTLGKTIGKGIMPAYPFFILSSIIYYEAFERPLNQEITSEGYCYQAIIYLYLRKQKVKNDEIDTYLTFLTEFAFHIYKENKWELSSSDFDLFMKLYTEKYNLPIKRETLLKKLTYIVSPDNLNNYSFEYQYLYYFFVAKYLADHIEDEEIDKKIENIMKNLHVDENAYIAIFLAHNSKNTKILKKIEDISFSLFDKYEPATLKKDEVKFFDEQVNDIIERSLPSPHSTAEAERKRRLDIEDEYDELEEDLEQKDDKDDDYLSRELRRSIKTVEVIGCIIKNRSGSLEKTKLENIFKEAMNVHLRILSSFFGYIKNTDGQKETIDVISSHLKKIVEENEGINKPDDLELRKLAKTIFWNLNFLFVTGIINKIISSLGSDKLATIVIKVCDEVDTPASNMVKEGILMWYEKNLRINELDKMFKRKDFSKIAERTARYMIVDYCSVHQINYKQRQTLTNKFRIPKRVLTIGPNEEL